MTSVPGVYVAIDIDGEPDPPPTDEEWRNAWAWAPELTPTWPDAPPEWIPQLRQHCLAMLRAAASEFHARETRPNRIVVNETVARWMANAPRRERKRANRRKRAKRIRRGHR